MLFRWYLFGEVCFNTTQKRNAALRRLDTRIAQTDLVPEIWRAIPEAIPEWNVGGQILLVKDGLPAVRFCYATNNYETVVAAEQEVSQAWDIFQDSNSWWGFGAEPIV